MDPQTPRQPEFDTPTDDLQDALQWFKGFVAEYHFQIVLVLFVVVLVIFVPTWTAWRTETVRESGWGELATSDAITDLQALQRSGNQPEVQALAALRVGDDLLSEATIGKRLVGENVDGSPQTQTLEPAEREQALDAAAEAYAQVLGMPRLHPAIQLNASLGLASIDEARGDLDRAAERYQRIIDQELFQSSAIQAIARGRLARLDDLARPVPLGLDEPTPAVETVPSRLPDMNFDLSLPESPSVPGPGLGLDPDANTGTEDSAPSPSQPDASSDGSGADAPAFDLGELSLPDVAEPDMTASDEQP